jgi:hypothetical protein
VLQTTKEITKLVTYILIFSNIDSILINLNSTIARFAREMHVTARKTLAIVPASENELNIRRRSSRAAGQKGGERKEDIESQIKISWNKYLTRKRHSRARAKYRADNFDGRVYVKTRTSFGGAFRNSVPYFPHYY